jgi:hypothetical protein
MTMTTPTIQEIAEQQAETWKTFEARINARSEAKADNAADIKAAGGLASDMTLRDHFAGQALVAIMPNKRTESYVHAAAESYKMADAMLEARKTTWEGEV